MSIARRTFSIAAMLVGSLFVLSAARAVTVSPVLIDDSVAPGMSLRGKMYVTNDSKQDLIYYVTIQSFVAEGEEGGQQYLPETDISGLPSWFVLPDRSFTLEPGKTKEVAYLINVPPNAEPGGHYAAVFYNLKPDQVRNGSGVGIGAKTGILFLLNVSGDVIEQARIESFTVNQPIFSHLPAMMSLRIRNMGNVHFRPVGTLTVRNMWGGIVARVPANPRNGAVLPNSIRRLDTWWVKDTNLDNSGSFFGGLKNEWNNFALGRYTATVDVKYGSRNTALEPRTVSFWVIPWRLCLILLALLIILFLGMKAYNRALVSSALKRSGSKR